MSDAENAADRLRLDKWLWRARFYKTRPLAAAAIAGGKVRVNGAKQTKPGAGLKIGDALTIAKSGKVTVIRVEAFGARRGPAAEAQTLYTTLD
ncbi:MAG: RNA-binding S4 domain-containing protein [Pseudomonadota bacterium]